MNLEPYLIPEFKVILAGEEKGITRFLPTRKGVFNVVSFNYWEIFSARHIAGYLTLFYNCIYSKYGEIGWSRFFATLNSIR